MDYLLLFFGKSEKQDDFVQGVCQDVAVVSDLGDIKYYYGSESIIITFKCTESLNSIDSYLKELYEGLDLVYILLPYEHDKMSFKMDNDIANHLFDTKLPTEKDENMSGIENLVHKWYNQNPDNKSFDSDLCEPNESDEIKQIILKKSKKQEPSLDEILDKISYQGISSLTKKELSLLETYSK